MPARRHSNSTNALGIVLILVGVIAFATLFVGCTVAANKESTVQFRLLDKESVTTREDDGSTGHEYRLYTDQGNFVVKDSLLHWKFNSSDTYGRLESNHTYTCKALGYRSGALSAFPNIIDCTEVK